MTMNFCAACHAQEVEPLPRSPPSSQPRRTLATLQCCRRSLCETCLAPAVTSTLLHALWFDLDSDLWVPCPLGPCYGVLAVTTPDALGALYRSAGVSRDAAIHVQIFRRACALRAQLRATAPSLSREASLTAGDLHHRLASYRAMTHPFFDLGSESPLETSLASVFSPSGSIVRVPLLASLLSRCRSGGGRNHPPAKTCLVCAEDRPDLDLPYPEGWRKLTGRDFRGDLAWFGHPFPSAADLPACAAAHELDVCKQCIARYVGAALEGRGAAAVHDIKCPQEGCGHAYTPSELRAATDHATFSRYERLCLVGALAGEPGFRWCLRPGCQSGQIYEAGGCGSGGGAAVVGAREARRRGLPADAGDENRVLCQACGFAMCFPHQTPWHRGMTCAEYTALEAGGDADAETESWVRRNTKRCPGRGCGVPVEKGGGCFHMRCGSCGAEFCWECLADWARIWTPAGYDVRGHGKGCFFRSKGAPRPLFMRGDTVEEAVVRHERRERGERRGREA